MNKITIVLLQEEFDNILQILEDVMYEYKNDRDKEKAVIDLTNGIQNEIFKPNVEKR